MYLKFVEDVYKRQEGGERGGGEIEHSAFIVGPDLEVSGPKQIHQGLELRARILREIVVHLVAQQTADQLFQLGEVVGAGEFHAGWGEKQAEGGGDGIGLVPVDGVEAVSYTHLA